MRVLVTGSTGFLGGSVARFATLNGHEVLGLGRSSRARVEDAGEYLQKDLFHTDLSIIIRDFAPDVIFHAAGPASVDLSFAAPLKDFHEGVTNWANVLDGVRRSTLKPLVVFPSSAAVYGDPKNLPVPEDGVIAPISPYGFHKTMCEVLGREYSKCFGVDILICRFFSIFGINQRRLLLWELYERFTGSDENVWLEGTGTESRDYLDVEDASSALFKLIHAMGARRNETENAAGQHLIINIASGEEIGILELAHQVGRLVASEKTICCRGVNRRGEPQCWRADISLLRSLVPSWTAKPLRSALGQCVAGWRNANG